MTPMSKQDKIVRILVYTGFKASFDLALQMSLEKVEEVHPRICELETWQERLCAAQDPMAFYRQCVELYGRVYHESELDALLAFYESPIGRRVAASNLAVAAPLNLMAAHYADGFMRAADVLALETQ